MKKRLLPVAVLATAAFGLTACAGGSNGGDSGDVSAEGETLNVWIMEGTNPDSEAFFDEVGDAFTEETGAELNVEFVQWADAHDRFVTSIAGGTTPDVAETGTTWTAEFADAGALAPIGDFVEDEKPRRRPRRGPRDLGHLRRRALRHALVRRRALARLPLRHLRGARPRGADQLGRDRRGGRGHQGRAPRDDGVRGSRRRRVRRVPVGLGRRRRGRRRRTATSGSRASTAPSRRRASSSTPTWR